MARREEVYRTVTARFPERDGQAAWSDLILGLSKGPLGAHTAESYVTSTAPVL